MFPILNKFFCPRGSEVDADVFARNVAVETHTGRTVRSNSSTNQHRHFMLYHRTQNRAAQVTETRRSPRSEPNKGRPKLCIETIQPRDFQHTHGQFCRDARTVLSRRTDSIVETHGQYCRDAWTVLSRRTDSIVEMHGQYCRDARTVLSRRTDSIVETHGQYC